MCDPQHPRSGWDMLWELLMVYCPTLYQMEQAMMLVAMAKTGGVQTKAADLLGINRKTLSYKLRKPRKRWELTMEAMEAEEQRQFVQIRKKRRERLHKKG